MNLDDIERHIGTHIKMLRLSHKLSQKELSKRMGITYQQVQKYENGLNRISVSRLWQICKVFGITPDYLYRNILEDGHEGHEGHNHKLLTDNMASSQEIKMVLAFRKVDDASKKSLMIKMCEAMVEPLQHAS